MTQIVQVTAVGQTLMRSAMGQSCPEHLDKLRELLSKNHFVVSNFEPALHTEGIGGHTRTDGTPVHIAGIEILKEMQYLSMNLISMASNHKWDLGTDSIAASVDIYNTYPFAYSGVGKNFKDSFKARFIELENGLTGGIVAAATAKIREGASATDLRPGVAEIPFDGKQLDYSTKNKILAELRNASGQCDFLVFVYHNHIWMDDLAKTPGWAVEFARQCVDNGADMFLNHGAPLLGGLELYKDKAILYNLGSFAFQPHLKKWSNEKYRDTLFVTCEYRNRKVSSLELLPMRISSEENKFGFPDFVDAATANKILNDLNALNQRDFGKGIIISGEKGYLCVG